MLGIGPTLPNQLVRNGNWQTPMIRLGRLIKVPSAPLLALRGEEPAGVPSARTADARVTRSP